MSQRWANLQNVIDCDGEISVSYRASVGRVAAAIQEREVYAMLRVDGGELLPDILVRLDAAVAKAVEDEIFTYEINR